MERHGLPEVPPVGLARRRHRPVVLAGASPHERRVAVVARRPGASRGAVRRNALPIWSASAQPQTSVPAVMNVGARTAAVPALARRNARQARPRLGRRREDVRRAGRRCRPAKRPRASSTRSSGSRRGRVRDGEQGHRRARRRPGPDQLDLRPLRGQRLRRAAVLQDRRPALGRGDAALRRLRHRLDRRREEHAEADRHRCARRTRRARSSCSPRRC